MSVALANPSVIVNNEPWLVVPNSVVYDEGLGEQTMRAASSGGGQTEQVYSENVEENFGGVKFQIFPDPEWIDKLRAVKANRNENVVTVTGDVVDRGTTKSLRRTFTNAAIFTNYNPFLNIDIIFYYRPLCDNIFFYIRAGSHGYVFPKD